MRARVHFQEQAALQLERLEELTTAAHGEARDVAQETSQRTFPHAVPLETQREAARNVRAAVTSATAHCLCCSMCDACHFAFVLDNTFHCGFLFDSIPAYATTWHREHVPAPRALAPKLPASRHYASAGLDPLRRVRFHRVCGCG